MSNEDNQLEVGGVYVRLKDVRNPFEKHYAKIKAIESGYVQYTKGTHPEYLPSKPASKTIADFKDEYVPQ